MRLLPLLTLLAAVPACHLVLPLGKGSDTETDGPGTDRGSRDLIALSDLGDGSADDLVIVPCTVPCPTGDDCDALPQARDPERDLCNELLYEETFDTDPLAALRWSTTNGTWSWSADGWMEQTSTGNTDGTKDYYWARADDAKLSAKVQDVRYLVEARFRLGAVGDTDYWEAGLAARLGGPGIGPYAFPEDHVVCVARVDKVISNCFGCTPPRKILYPDLMLAIQNETGGTTAWPLDNPDQLYDASSGQVYIMQLWYREDLPQVNCRLVDDSSVSKRDATLEFHGFDPKYQTYLPTAAGTVGFRTWKRSASFDWIRVFQLHRPTS